MSRFTVTREATPDEMVAEIDRRGEVIERLETNLAHWREECGKLHSQIDLANEKLRLANTGGLPLLYDIRSALGWNDKTSLAKAIKAKVVELEEVNAAHKDRIGELLEELSAVMEEQDDEL